MKKLITIFTLILIFTTSIIAQTYNLQFVVVNNSGTNGGNFDVKIQIDGSSSFKLGASNIAFNFNSTGLDSPPLLQAFTFLPPNYGSMTVTNPLTGVASINIPFSQTDEAFATSVSQSPSWTDVATVRFTILNSSLTSQLTFRSADPSPTVVYKVTGSGSTFLPTLLSAGTWTPLDSPLPVELTTFSVTNKKGSAVDLKWETATEVNNYGFEVERSVIKKSDKLNSIESADRSWEKIGFIEGHGNSNSPKKYSFVDKNLVGGSHFVYRLKQVDVDGSFEYSEAIEIEVLPVKYQLDQNYPNPFNPTTTIKFSLPQAGKVRLDVYNLLGELITTLVNKNFEAGFQSVQFNASNLASGIYIYRLSSNSFSQVRKMMLLK